MFCDASVRYKFGGYAVVFNRYAPGTPNDGEKVGLAWPIYPSVGADLAEMVALIEALVQAKKELETLATLPVPDQHPLSAVVTIFSDSMESVKRISSGGKAKNDAINRLLQHLKTEEAKLEGLKFTTGTFVSVEYAWVPRHCIEQHKQADALAKTARMSNRAVAERDRIRVRTEKLDSAFKSVWGIFLAEQRRLVGVEVARILAGPDKFYEWYEIQQKRIQKRRDPHRSRVSRPSKVPTQKYARSLALAMLEEKYAREAEEQLYRESAEAYQRSLEGKDYVIRLKSAE